MPFAIWILSQFNLILSSLKNENSIEIRFFVSWQQQRQCESGVGDGKPLTVTIDNGSGLNRDEWIDGSDFLSICVYCISDLLITTFSFWFHFLLLGSTTKFNAIETRLCTTCMIHLHSSIVQRYRCKCGARQLNFQSTWKLKETQNGIHDINDRFGICLTSVAIVRSINVYYVCISTSS